ncbi:hypothetical protein NLX71_26340 [Paenibacillus sp. MZ04-78.2]|uniref:hypothetical protein n=1 Tax=Paenibacillus sp. MZ04-78.2 TaxID=2962034 RepID=UPI0020B79FC4|nr:hypothetical protein [Paenibacillus sp. MZ04-78.2]MCP3776757.1 hypothetical protein [Paenibacillus sp. MZ04-78.2]
MMQLLDGESQERIFYLVRIGMIFERLYSIKDLHDAVYRATTGAGVTAKMLAELGYSGEQIEKLLRERLFFTGQTKWDNRTIVTKSQIYGCAR